MPLIQNPKNITLRPCVSTVTDVIFQNDPLDTVIVENSVVDKDGNVFLVKDTYSEFSNNKAYLDWLHYTEEALGFLVDDTLSLIGFSENVVVFTYEIGDGIQINHIVKRQFRSYDGDERYKLIDKEDVL